VKASIRRILLQRRGDKLTAPTGEQTSYEGQGLKPIGARAAAKPLIVLRQMDNLSTGLVERS
jgi:hypothetical protein